MTGAEGEGDAGDAGSGSEAGQFDPSKRKGASKTRLLKTRLQKLVSKTDDEYVKPWFLVFTAFPDYIVSAAASCLQSSWNFRANDTGHCTTKSSSDRNALRTFSYVHTPS